MKRNSRAGSRTFFIEFLIALFFFLIISTVCLRVFARAHAITRRSEALSNAQTVAASITAVVEAGNISPEDAVSFFPDAVLTSNGFTLFYNRDFEVCSEDHAFYTLELALEQEEQEVASKVTVYDDTHEVLYELSSLFHQPFTRKEVLS